MESWYQGDAKKMEEVLHKDFAKKIAQPGYGYRNGLKQISASDMISWTRSRYGKPLWTKDMDIEVTVLDFHNEIASVKVVTQHYFEYIHLIKMDGKWVIINTGLFYAQSGRFWPLPWGLPWGQKKIEMKRGPRNVP